ncbi:hypothetical protein CON65_00270 [Bacillus pseudomycoides]|uniref:UPF0473 protein CON65_00270 n=1 Tax=Bacillus pseudomycoides TaxID=64104 RepID=A0AA91VGI0_9BACI|nr:MULTISPECIES: DUF1292 domain-containing protein [Bacillus]PEB53465.1 hypothetical protein COO03_09945 [Bacillus sp. AFS098217]PED84574.1 hypothetical protein CON65_00270 [Bacillus pseudomycoides]PEU14864.1 hypothetical protein CN524_09270 [Bacillus sp. AFS019443]PEU19384.1 hypothetical protein CN525_06500 [Bacillus sp. AFS014408]PFW64535.1 hypothetical protein COL20_05210 [Bacillus sp. AFS075034]
MEENQITIVDEKGNEHLCEIIFTFDAEKFGNKSYVVFSPIGEVDEDGDPIYDAMAYEQSEDESGGTLLPIESEEEWEMVQEMFNTLAAEEDGEE